MVRLVIMHFVWKADHFHAFQEVVLCEGDCTLVFFSPKDDLQGMLTLHTIYHHNLNLITVSIYIIDLFQTLIATSYNHK